MNWLVTPQSQSSDLMCGGIFLIIACRKTEVFCSSLCFGVNCDFCVGVYIYETDSAT